MRAAPASLVFVLWMTSWQRVPAADPKVEKTKKSPPKQAKSTPQELAPAGREWQCYELVENDAFGGCHRFPVECEAARAGDLLKGQAVSKCASQRNAAVITYYSVMGDFSTWIALPSMKACKVMQRFLRTEEADDVRNVSPCTLIGAKEKPLMNPNVPEIMLRAYVKAYSLRPEKAFCYSWRTDADTEVSSCRFTMADCEAVEAAARKAVPEAVLEKCAGYKSVDATPARDEIHFTKSPEHCANFRAWYTVDGGLGTCVHLDL